MASEAPSSEHSKLETIMEDDDRRVPVPRIKAGDTVMIRLPSEETRSIKYEGVGYVLSLKWLSSPTRISIELST